MKASKMAAAEEAQNEASVQNLVDVENTAMVPPRVCNVSCTRRRKIERDTVIESLECVLAKTAGLARQGYARIESLERDLAKSADWHVTEMRGSQPSLPDEQTSAASRQIPKAK